MLDYCIVFFDMRRSIFYLALLVTTHFLQGTAIAKPKVGSVRTKVGFSALTGHPDLFGVSVSLGYPNILELDSGASFAPLSGWTAHARLGYPFVVFDYPDRNYQLFLIPKIGVRRTKYKGGASHHCPMYNCDAYYNPT